MTARTHQVMLRCSDEELAALDAVRSTHTRAAFVREAVQVHIERTRRIEELQQEARQRAEVPDAE